MLWFKFKPAPVAEWAFNLWPLTRWERIQMGWVLWRDGVKRFPWPE